MLAGVGRLPRTTFITAARMQACPFWTGLIDAAAHALVHGSAIFTGRRFYPVKHAKLAARVHFLTSEHPVSAIRADGKRLRFVA